MENKGLLFIPDISGFTRFVNETSIDHSRIIIQELLEILINSNKIGLEVSEIEGDAILFYKFGEAPDIEKLYEQVASMFCAFHRHLVAYEFRRFCQCEACQSAIGLSLKVITHYGEFTGYTIKNFNKLIGKDIIVAHRLLKNDIEQHEYWLITRNLLQDHSVAGLPAWINWNSNIQQMEGGEISFQYTPLTPLKNDLPPEILPNPELAKKIKVISASREYDAAIIPVFHATGDFNYRSRWQKDVKAMEEVQHVLPRLGMRGHRVMENGKSVIYYSSYTYHPDRIEFSETEENKNTTTCYTLEKISDLKTRVTIDYYIPRNFISNLLFNLTKKKKLEENIEQSLVDLDPVVRAVRLPGQPFLNTDDTD